MYIVYQKGIISKKGKKQGDERNQEQVLFSVLMRGIHTEDFILILRAVLKRRQDDNQHLWIIAIIPQWYPFAKF